jgi:hypothetical protein
MKTTNNAQKTETGKMNTLVIRGGASIIIFVFISFSVVAQNYWKQLLNGNENGKMTLLFDDNLNQSEELLATEVSFYAYQSADGLCNLTSPNTKINQMSASETDEFLVAAEELTAQEADREVERYAQKLMLNEDVRKELEKHKANLEFLTEAEELTAFEADQEIEMYAEKQMLLEKSRNELETLKVNEEFQHTAELITSVEADQQIDRFATQLISIQENRTEELNFIQSAEADTAVSADQEIEKYTQKMISAVVYAEN